MKSTSALSSSMLELATAKTRHLFTGEQLSPSTGLGYHRARWLAFEVGRLTQMDQFLGVDRKPITLAKYGYASANPVNYSDPSGNFTLTGMMSTISTISINIASRAVIFSWRHPALTTLGLTIGGAVLLPTELQVPTPMSFAPSAMGATSGSISAAGKHLSATMRLFRDKLGVLAGGEFEKFVATLLNLKKNTTPYTVDLLWRKEVKFIPDFVRASGFLEVKAVRGLSGRDFLQAEKLAAFAARNGKTLEYLFLRKPSAGDLLKLENAVGEGTQGVEINFSYNWIFE